MKKKLIAATAIIFFLSLNVFCQEVLSASKELGLVSYLTTVKSFSEFKMSSLASDPKYIIEPEKAKIFQMEYNQLKLSIDRFLNQLVADMTLKNRLMEYRKINRFIKGDKDKLPARMKAYEKSLKEIDGQLETFILKSYSSKLAGPTIEDILGGVELTHTIIADMRDFREKKVSNISSQLKELKLTSLKDLTEEKKKE